MPVFLERQDLQVVVRPWQKYNGFSAQRDCKNLARHVEVIAELSSPSKRYIFIDGRVGHPLSANLRQNAQVFIKFQHVKSAWSASKNCAHRNIWQVDSNTKTISVKPESVVFVELFHRATRAPSMCVLYNLLPFFEGTYACVVGQNFDQANVRTHLYFFPSTFDTSRGEWESAMEKSSWKSFHSILLNKEIYENIVYP